MKTITSALSKLVRVAREYKGNTNIFRGMTDIMSEPMRDYGQMLTNPLTEEFYEALAPLKSAIAPLIETYYYLLIQMWSPIIITLFNLIPAISNLLISWGNYDKVRDTLERYTEEENWKKEVAYQNLTLSYPSGTLSSIHSFNVDVNIWIGMHVAGVTDTVDEKPILYSGTTTYCPSPFWYLGPNDMLMSKQGYTSILTSPSGQTYYVGVLFLASPGLRKWLFNYNAFGWVDGTSWWIKDEYDPLHLAPGGTA